MKKYMLISALLCMLFVPFGLQAQNSIRIPLIGEKAPDFIAKTTQGTLNFPGDYGRSWKILFSHPRDFTPVCSSELLELAQMQSFFKAFNVKLVVVSSDKLAQHVDWENTLDELRYKGRKPVKIDFPLVDDYNHVVAKKYGMLHQPTSTTEYVRGVFIIDGKNIVRAVFFYPHSVGRNMDEIKRTVIALQTTDKEHVFTPANWYPGDDVLIPYFPYTQKELKDNPQIAEQFYSVGSLLHFRKSK